MAVIDKIRINEHSSIRVESEEGKVIYFDPYNIPEEKNSSIYNHDADIIFVTHSHYDHFSPEDIEKIIKRETTIVAPKSMKDEIRAYERHDIVLFEPDEEKEILGFDVKAVPAYNIGKPFHTKERDWLGYVVAVDGKKVYVCGDTNLNDDTVKVSCDILLAPCGGTYTMDYREAAELTNILRPEFAIPTHYGTVAGDKDCGEKFAKLVNAETEVRVLI